MVWDWPHVSIRSPARKSAGDYAHSCDGKAIFAADYSVVAKRSQCGGGASSPGFVFFFREIRFSASTKAEKAMAA